MGIRRADFASVGGFDTTYEPGEDIDLSMRLWLEGINLHFEPDATVQYRLRSTLTDVFGRSMAYGRVRPRICEALARAGGPRPRRTEGLRNWVWLARKLPILRSRTGRAEWLWIAGRRVGNLVGGLHVRRLYL